MDVREERHSTICGCSVLHDTLYFQIRFAANPNPCTYMTAIFTPFIASDSEGRTMFNTASSTIAQETSTADEHLGGIDGTHSSSKIV